MFMDLLHLFFTVDFYQRKASELGNSETYAYANAIFLAVEMFLFQIFSKYVDLKGNDVYSKTFKVYVLPIWGFRLVVLSIWNYLEKK
jgi:hypothetical protein